MKKCQLEIWNFQLQMQQVELLQNFRFMVAYIVNDTLNKTPTRCTLF